MADLGCFFSDFGGWFFLRISLQNEPQNLIFGACGAKKCEKNAFLSTWKNDQKSLFYTVE